MHSQRREFLKKLSLLSGGLTMPGLINASIEKNISTNIEKYSGYSPESLAMEEDFWHQIKQAYTIAPGITNLNNGGVCPQPKAVQEAVELYNKLSNQAPSYYMWRILDQGREPLREKLALIAGSPSEEIAIDRNATEALETIIFGLSLQKGDEVVLSYQDYPNMMNAWKQREMRDGIVLKWVDFPIPAEDDEEIVQYYKDQITEKTKIVHVTHVVNWTGQILPVKKIATMAHEAGAEVIVDAAHSFAHLDYKIPDLDGDYFGTSLHKWLCAPFGSGMLQIKKEKIAKIYPLFAAPNPIEDNIRKFEHLGTRSFAIEQAIAQAANFHEMIGIKRKQQRLQYLKHSWASRAMDIPGVQVPTSLDPNYSCALCLLQIEGKTPGEVANQLFRDFKIHVSSINYRNISGCRITPNVYTMKSDMDRLVMAIDKIAST